MKFLVFWVWGEKISKIERKVANLVLDKIKIKIYQINNKNHVTEHFNVLLLLIIIKSGC